MLHWVRNSWSRVSCIYQLKCCFKSSGNCIVSSRTYVYLFASRCHEWLDFCFPNKSTPIRALARTAWQGDRTMWTECEWNSATAVHPRSTATWVIQYWIRNVQNFSLHLDESVPIHGLLVSQDTNQFSLFFLMNTWLEHTLRSIKIDQIAPCLISFSSGNPKKFISNTFINTYQKHEHFIFLYWLFYLARRFYCSRLSTGGLLGPEGPRSQRESKTVGWVGLSR